MSPPSVVRRIGAGQRRGAKHRKQPVDDAGGQRTAAFGGAAWPQLGLGAAAVRGLPAIWTPGAPHRGPRPAPNRDGRSATMKWVRIDEIWYKPGA